MSANPLVSVIIPVWNGAPFLREAVASILAQHYMPLEILILDDGSTDDTPQIAASLPGEIRYVLLPHRGVAQTRLAGLDAARGDLIASLDVDDLWTSNKLQLQLKLLEANPDILIVNGYTQLMRLVETTPEGMRFENWDAPVLTFSFGSAIFRREGLAQLGTFSESAARLDLDWFMRARERNIPMLTHPDVVYYYRRHRGNSSNDHDTAKRELLKMLKDSLTRRGAVGQTAVPLAPLTDGVQSGRENKDV